MVTWKALAIAAAVSASAAACLATDTSHSRAHKLIVEKLALMHTELAIPTFGKPHSTSSHLVVFPLSTVDPTASATV